MPFRRNQPTDPFDLINDRLRILEAQVRALRNNRAPTVPFYDSAHWPAQSVNGQLVIAPSFVPPPDLSTVTSWTASPQIDGGAYDLNDLDVWCGLVGPFPGTGGHYDLTTSSYVAASGSGGAVPLFAINDNLHHLSSSYNSSAANFAAVTRVPLSYFNMVGNYTSHTDWVYDSNYLAYYDINNTDHILYVTLAKRTPSFWDIHRCVVAVDDPGNIILDTLNDLPRASTFADYRARYTHNNMAGFTQNIITIVGGIPTTNDWRASAVIDGVLKVCPVTFSSFFDINQNGVVSATKDVGGTGSTFRAFTWDANTDTIVYADSIITDLVGVSNAAGGINDYGHMGIKAFSGGSQFDTAYVWDGASFGANIGGPFLTGGLPTQIDRILINNNVRLVVSIASDKVVSITPVFP